MNAPLYLDFCREDKKLSLLENVGDSARFSIVATRREGGFACSLKSRIAECTGSGCGTLDICSNNLSTGINGDAHNNGSFARLVGIGRLCQIFYSSVADNG